MAPGFTLAHSSSWPILRGSWISTKRDSGTNWRLHREGPRAVRAVAVNHWRKAGHAGSPSTHASNVGGSSSRTILAAGNRTCRSHRSGCPSSIRFFTCWVVGLVREGGTWGRQTHGRRTSGDSLGRRYPAKKDPASAHERVAASLRLRWYSSLAVGTPGTRRDEGGNGLRALLEIPEWRRN